MATALSMHKLKFVKDLAPLNFSEHYNRVSNIFLSRFLIGTVGRQSLYFLKY